MLQLVFNPGLKLTCFRSAQIKRVDSHSVVILFTSVVRTERSVGSKSKHCPDPSETVDNYINYEFPDKIVVIKLDLTT